MASNCSDRCVWAMRISLLLHAIDPKVVSLGILKVLHNSTVAFWDDFCHLLPTSFDNLLFVPKVVSLVPLALTSGLTFTGGSPSRTTECRPRTDTTLLRLSHANQ